MLMPSDGKALAAAIPAFTSGLATGYLGAKKSQREDAVSAGETPEAPGRFESFIQAANPDERRTVDETLSMDLGTLSKELGGMKTSEELLNWVAKNSALVASPIGGKMLNVIGQTAERMSAIETQSLGHITAKRMAIEKADLMVKYGLGPDAPADQIATARATENEMSFMSRAAKDMDKDVSGLITSQDFDTNGNWLPGTMQRILKAAPFLPITSRTGPTANIQDVEKMAELRTQIAALPEGSPQRMEFETQLSDLTAVVKGGQQLRARTLDLKADAQAVSKGFSERRLRLSESLPPIQEAALKAELAIIDDSIKLMNDDAAKAFKVAEIIAKYERLSNSTAPAPLPGTTNGTPRLRWDPATRRLIPTTNAPARGLSPNVDALDPVTVP